MLIRTHFIEHYYYELKKYPEIHYCSRYLERIWDIYFFFNSSFGIRLNLALTLFLDHTYIQRTYPIEILSNISKNQMFNNIHLEEQFIGFIKSNNINIYI